MTKWLHISETLALPLDAVTQAMAFLGRRGSGKTYASTSVAEKMIDERAQIVALDPVGVWYGLRLAANGKSPGISIPVFGGLHGDIPLEPTGGKLLADLIVDRGISAVVDVSQFEHDTDKARFAFDFAARLFFRKKSAPSAIHVFLEECQEFVPQNPAKGEEHMLHAFNRMVRLGRNFGIGVSLISQRPQDVNKKALNQAECVFAFQLTGPHERKAVEGWIAEKGLDLDLVAALPKLKTGHAHVWSPSWLEISEEITFAKKRTFNASSTPEVGSKRTVRELAPIELDQLREDMKQTIDRAKADDPRELRRRIAELERSAKALLAGNFPSTGDLKLRTQLENRITALEAELVKTIDDAKKREAEVASKLDEALRDLKEVGIHIYSARSSNVVPMRVPRRYTSAPPTSAQLPIRAPSLESQVPPLDASDPVERAAREARRHTPSTIPRVVDGTRHATTLKKGARDILVAITAAADGLTRSQAATVCNIKPTGSTFSTYMSNLRLAGYIEEHADRIRPTALGAKHARELDPHLHTLTTEEVQLQWSMRMKRGARMILEALIQAHPRAIDRMKLAEQLGIETTGSTLSTYVSNLARNGLVVKEGQALRASDEIMGMR